MPAYVTLPGTSGNYFSTPDVNLLDADTAHMHQSVGLWVGAGGFTTPTVQTAPGSPPFGTKAARYVSANDASAGTAWHGNPGTVATPISSSTEYSYSVWVYAADRDTTCNLDIRYSDSGGTTISTIAGTDDFAVAQGTWVELSVTLTSPGTAAYVSILVRFDEGGETYDSGETFWVSACCIRTGSDGTFIPSLRIVGDLDIEAKIALDDYTPAATNTILDCLNSNDGYRLRHTTGDLIEIAYGNGSSTRVQTSSATGLTDGNDHVFKVTVDQSTGAVVYYIDGVQHDTDTMTAGAGQPDINDLVVGANAAASANWTDGDLYYVIVRDGISGPVVARFDADDWVGV